MSTYRMADGTVVKTENARAHWNEDTQFDGHNHISVATGSQWTHERLYCSRKGRYYIVKTSQYQGSRDYAEWVSPQGAVRWLLTSEHDLPADLKQYEDAVTE